MDSGIGKNIDRLSNLPDCLVCHILSFLETKYAVGTSILATRWRNLWTYIPKLVFYESEVFVNNDSEEVDKSFVRFVTRVLSYSQAPCFQTLRLQVYSYEAFDNLGSWISLAIERNVQRLYIRNICDLHLVLPSEFFTSSTLVVLILYGAYFDVPDSVKLPNLKIASLGVENDQEDSLENFLAGCPVLEDLCIRRIDFEDRRRLIVSSPNLKCLTIECDWYELDDYGYVYQDRWCEIELNAPKLEELNFSDYYLDNFCFKNLSSLAEAFVCVGRIRQTAGGFTEEGLPIYKLLSGISNVKILHARLFYHTDVDYTLPTFHKLAKLSLGSDEFSYWNLSLVTDFLQCSPNLEVLVLEGSRHGSWKQPRQVPDCLSSSLEEVHIEECSGEDYELEMIEYLLKNAKVLKKMEVDCSDADDGFMEALAAFPMGSDLCQLTLI